MTTTKSDVAWLIEKVQAARAGGPEYYAIVDMDDDRPSFGWSTDPNAGLRFPTGGAAQEYIDVHDIEHAVAVEHAWV